MKHGLSIYLSVQFVFHILLTYAMFTSTNKIPVQIAFPIIVITSMENRPHAIFEK